MASDLIYREDAKDFVRHAYHKGLNPVEYLDEVPAADVVEVRHGRWILFDKTFGTVVCDQCHRQDHFDLLAKYCRYCGSKMDGGVNDATD